MPPEGASRAGRRSLSRRDASRLVGSVAGFALTAATSCRLDAPTTALLGAILWRLRGGARSRLAAT